MGTNTIFLYASKARQGYLNFTFLYQLSAKNCIMLWYIVLCYVMVCYVKLCSSLIFMFCSCQACFGNINIALADENGKLKQHGKICLCIKHIDRIIIAHKRCNVGQILPSIVCSSGNKPASNMGQSSDTWNWCLFWHILSRLLPSLSFHDLSCLFCLFLSLGARPPGRCWMGGCFYFKLVATGARSFHLQQWRHLFLTAGRRVFYRPFPLFCVHLFFFSASWN